LFGLGKPLGDQRHRTNLPALNAQEIIQEAQALNVLATAVEVEQQERQVEIDEVNPSFLD